MQEEKKLTQVHSTFSGKNDKEYYFIPIIDREEAIREAHKYKSPVPQCFQKWEYFCPARSGSHVFFGNKKFMPTKDGSILIFNRGSAS